MTPPQEAGFTNTAPVQLQQEFAKDVLKKGQMLLVKFTNEASVVNPGRHHEVKTHAKFVILNPRTTKALYVHVSTIRMCQGYLHFIDMLYLCTSTHTSP